MSEKKKKTQPVRYTNKKIIDALRKTNGYVLLAARLLGCSQMTIYRKISSSEAIRQELEMIREGELDLAEQKLREAIMRGEPWAIALKLKTQGKKRGYTERTEITGAEDAEPVKIIIERYEPDSEPTKNKTV